MKQYAVAFLFKPQSRRWYYQAIKTEIVEAQHEQAAETRARIAIAAELRYDQERGSLRLLYIDEIEEATHERDSTEASRDSGEARLKERSGT
jgi:FixJ family two-component response regulator